MYCIQCDSKPVRLQKASFHFLVSMYSLFLYFMVGSFHCSLSTWHMDNACQCTMIASLFRSPTHTSVLAQSRQTFQRDTNTDTDAPTHCREHLTISQANANVQWSRTLFLKNEVFILMSMFLISGNISVWVMERACACEFSVVFNGCIRSHGDAFE